MATPALVQLKCTGATGANNGDTGTAFLLVLPNASLTNNCLVLCVTYQTGKTITLSDNKSNSWPAATVAQVDSGAATKSSIYVLPAATAGTQTITITFNTATTCFQAVVMEWTNIATSSPVQSSVSNNASAGPTVTAGSFTPGNGNLVLNYAVDTNFGTSLGTTNIPTNMAAMTSPAFSLEAVSYNYGVAVQSLVSATSGAINPTITVTEGADTDAYNSLAVSLISASSGTAIPAGIRILRVMEHRLPGVATSPFTTGFPCTGNLLVGTTDANYASGASIWSATSDGTNTWTQVSVNAGNQAPQVWFAGNATPSRALKLTITIDTTSGGTWIWKLYDIVGAATSPFDVEADNFTSSTAKPFTAANAPTITPTTANGLILAVAQIGSGPCDTVSTTGGIFDNTHYTGGTADTDGSGLNNGDAWQHVYNATATAVHFAWHMTGSGSSALSETAVAFKAAAGAPTDTTEWRGCYPPARGRDDGNIGYNLG